MIDFYGRTLKFVLRFQTTVLLIAVGHSGADVFLYIVAPKGFFPVQDTGVIQGISQAPETISFPAMAEKHQELTKVILADPAVESLTSFIGADGTNTTLNSGRFSINLKPLDDAVSAPRMSFAGCKPSCRTSRESSSSCSRCRTSPSMTG